MPADKTASSHYYDSAVGERLGDFVYANPRVEGALQFAAGWMPDAAAAILDIGCGIGWSSAWALAQRPTARVTGVDLSPDGIGVARALFPERRLDFLCGDVTGLPEADLAGPFDAVLMLDVWEHVPAGRRGALNATLSRCLAERGCIIAAFPSTAGLQRLRDKEPGRLQPVDEDITDEVVDALCAAAQVSVRARETVGIWRPGDYEHLVLARPGYTAPADTGAALCASEPRRRVPERAARVERALGVAVTRHGTMLPQRNGPRVALFCRDMAAAETPGVRAHIGPLRATVDLFAGPAFARGPDGTRLLSFGYWSRVRRTMRRAMHPDLPSGWFERRALARHLRRGGYQVALAEGAAVGAAIAQPCREAGLPLVVRFLGPEAYCGRPADHAALFGNGAAFVASSGAMAERLVALGASQGKVHCSPPGVDCSRIQVADAGADPPAFIGAGAFVPRKGHHLTILAFQRLLAECSDATLVLFGDGPLLGACRDLVDALGLGGAIGLPGQAARATVLDSMAGARAFVQHSVTARDGDTEGVPLAVLEAGAARLPVVATRHGGIPEAVADGTTGLLVDERNVAGMAGHMVALTKDAGLARRLGAAARERMAERYDRSRAAQALMQVLTDVAAD